MSETPASPPIAEEPSLRSHDDRAWYLAGVASGLLLAQPPQRRNDITMRLIAEEAIAAYHLPRQTPRQLNALQHQIASLSAQPHTPAAAFGRLLAAQIGNPAPVARKDIERWAAALGLPEQEAAPLSLHPPHNGNTGDTSAIGAAALFWHRATVRDDLDAYLALFMAHRALGRALDAPPPLLASALYGLNPTESFSVWLSSFAQAVVAGRERTVQFIRFLIAKYRFLDAHPSLLNHRERDALSKLFEADPFASNSCLRASTYRDMTGASVASATRDLNHLVEAGFLSKSGVKRHTQYCLVI